LSDTPLLKRVLFVDDEPAVLEAFELALRKQRGEWELVFEQYPERALRRVEHEHFDVVVTDVDMPVMSGIDLIRHMASGVRSRFVPVIVVTGRGDTALKSQALDAGAIDLLNKPVARGDLLARIRSALRLSEAEARLRQNNEELEMRVAERSYQLSASRLEILWKLGKAAEYRDEQTGTHVVRVGCFSKVIAEAMGLSTEVADTVFLAAPLHDVGKIGIPDHILLKPGKLDDEEWAIMRQHCQMGASILSGEWEAVKPLRRLVQGSEPLISFTGASAFLVEGLGGFDNPIVEMASSIALSHHERWDGGGYPFGWAGDEIPVAARVVSIADAYDAMRSVRPYKAAMPIERTQAIIRAEAGKQFDPGGVEAFLSVADRIEAIERELTDSTSERPHANRSQTPPPLPGTRGA